MHEPDAVTSRPRLRWRWISLGIFIVVPAIVLTCLAAFLNSDTVPTDRIQPPRDLLTIQPGTAQSKSTPVYPSQPYEIFLTAAPNQSAAAIYRKWSSTFDLPNQASKNPLEGWIPGEPLNDGQIQWLLDRRELVEDLLKLADMGGVPAVSCGQAASFNLIEFYQLPVPNYLFMSRCSTMLAAESQRRWTSGDREGAIQHLLAIYPLAQSIREPFMISHLIAVMMQERAESELSTWLIKGDLPDGLARRLRSKLKENSVSLTQFRRIIEVEYLTRRNHLLKSLRGSVADLWRYAGLKTAFSKDKELADVSTFGLLSSIARMTGRCASTAIWSKSHAAQVLDECDAKYREFTRSIDTNRFAQGDKDYFEYYDPGPCMRTKRAIALHALNLAALELGMGEPVTESDPFPNKPLSPVDETTSTMIYSIGPDMIDQRGALRYDPTNGTFSTGDIFIRVPKK